MTWTKDKTQKVCSMLVKIILIVNKNTTSLETAHCFLVTFLANCLAKHTQSRYFWVAMLTFNWWLNYRDIARTEE